MSDETSVVTPAEVAAPVNFYSAFRAKTEEFIVKAADDTVKGRIVARRHARSLRDDLKTYFKASMEADKAIKAELKEIREIKKAERAARKAERDAKKAAKLAASTSTSETTVAPEVTVIG